MKMSLRSCKKEKRKFQPRASAAHRSLLALLKAATHLLLIALAYVKDARDQIGRKREDNRMVIFGSHLD